MAPCANALGRGSSATAAGYSRNACAPHFGCRETSRWCTCQGSQDKDVPSFSWYYLEAGPEIHLSTVFPAHLSVE